MYLSKVVKSHSLCLRLCLSGLAASFFLMATVSATEIDLLTAKLPRAFIGEFTWDGDKTAQNVVITFDSVRGAERAGCRGGRMRFV